ncbi:MAG: TonB family protein [Phyllobacterium sp.]
MSGWNAGNRLGFFGELGLWTGASLIVLTAHVGAAAWLMRELPVEAAAPEPPAAIMIDLAPEPVVEEVSEEEIAEEAPQASEPVQEEVMPEEVPEPTEEVAEEPPVEQEVAEEAPEPELVEPVEEIDPVQEMVETQLENIEVPIPVRRPPPPERKVVEKEKPRPRETRPKREEKKAAAEAPKPKPAKTQQAASKAKAPSTRSDRTAASQSSKGMFASKMSPAKWQSKLAAYLERRKRYPRGAKSRREEGVVSVQFTIDGSGNVMSSRIIRSSGYAELDGEVLSLLKRASPVPAPPAEANRTITAPFRFNIR